MLAAAAVAAAETGWLMSRHPALGATAFTLAIVASVWIRRYGRRTAHAGMVLVVPFIAALVSASPTAPRPAQLGWSAALAAVTVFWVSLFQLAAGSSIRSAPKIPVTASKARRLRHNTRTSAQMAAALAAAFAAGHLLFGDHWAWVVLTAFIVGNGARTRHEALQKGVHRAIGAAVGTVLATWIAGAFGPHDPRSVVVIFGILAVATWLRTLHYAYWAGSVTAALALLYGYFGENATSLAHIRLEAILVGAVIGASTSWLALRRKRTSEPDADAGRVQDADRRADHLGQAGSGDQALLAVR